MENDKYEVRKAKSVEMLNAGVTPVKDGFNVFWIPSQIEQGKRYKVTIKQGWYACECPDNSQNKNLCKHILLLKTHLAVTLKAREEAQHKATAGFSCPYCSSVSVVRDGCRKTTLGLRQKWLCHACSKRFVNEPVSRIKGNVDTVTVAIDLYMRGVSYRGVQEHLRQFFGLKINHVTVMRWIQTYLAKITEHTDKQHPEVSQRWHADEQMVNIAGKHKWVWNCLDSKTRFLLSNKVSPVRTTADARELFQKAKETASDKAMTVVTDGAFAYEKAVNKEFSALVGQEPLAA